MYDKKLLGYVVPEYGLERKKNSDSSAPPQKKFCIAMIEKSVSLLQSTLPNPNGTPKYDNLADLERLLKEIGNGYITGIRADMRVPFALQAKLRTDMMSVNDAISADLANLAETSFVNDIIPGELWERAAPMLQRGAKDFSGAVGENDRSFHRYLALKDLERIGYGQFLYVSENATATCDVCAAQHGKTYSMREMEASGKIPPVHANCKCSLVALDTAAKNSYNLNRQSFIEDVERRLLGRSGGIYRSAQDFARGGFSLSPVRVSTEPIISDGGAGSNWYDGLRDWAVDFGTDAKAAWDAFCYGFAERDKNKLNDLPSFLDWLTAGIVSGTLAASAGRWEQMFRDPSLYSVLNYVSVGVLDTVNHAVNPEKPFSFAQWMSSLEVVMLTYSAYKTVEQATALRAAPASDKPLDAPNESIETPAPDWQGGRPTWRQSELDAAADFPDHLPQKSFINGQEVTYGTEGSVRPDYYQLGHSVDVKNYNITTARGRSGLARNIERQYAERLNGLPVGTKQTVLVDFRGQSVTESTLDLLRQDILKRTNNGVEILFKGK